MARARAFRILAGAGLAAGALASSYRAFWRTKCLTWGATPEEAARAMPGDELAPDADEITTRAVTVAAPAECIWPWLVQMGSGRGGAYTYDWIENLFGLNMHSADRILPQYQDLKVGDEFATGGNGPRMRVAVLEPERALAFAEAEGNWVWIFALYPQDGATRLVSRNRIKIPAGSAAARAAWALLMEPGSLVMERKMLTGIKDRAERLARERSGTGEAGHRGEDAALTAAR